MGCRVHYEPGSLRDSRIFKLNTSKPSNTYFDLHA